MVQNYSTFHTGESHLWLLLKITTKSPNLQLNHHTNITKKYRLIFKALTLTNRLF